MIPFRAVKAMGESTPSFTSRMQVSAVEPAWMELKTRCPVNPASTAVLDGAVIVVDATTGVQVGTDNAVTKTSSSGASCGAGSRIYVARQQPSVRSWRR